MRTRRPCSMLGACAPLAAMLALVLLHPGFAQSGGAAGPAAQKLPARIVPLDRVYFSNYETAPAFQLVRPGGEPATIHGLPVSFEEDGRELVAIVEGKKTRARGKGTRLKLGKRSVLLAKVVLPPHLAGEGKTELAEAWVWAPAEGSAARFGRETLVGLDLDMDGSYWEAGEDGVVYPGSSYVIPLGPVLVVGNTSWTIEGASEDALSASAREDRGIDGNAGEMEGLRLWNDYRVKAGLPAAWLDAKLSEEAALHCRYLEQNPGDAHDEFPGKPGYTEAGKAAGGRSCIHYKVDAPGTVIGMLTELYHKRPLVDPSTGRIGIAARHGHTLLDGYGGKEARSAAGVRWPLAFPAHDQTIQGVPFEHENPDPLPAGIQAGSSVLLVFEDYGAKDALLEASLSRLDKGGWLPVEAWISGPDKPANTARPNNVGCIALFAKRGMSAATWRVQVRYKDRSGAEHSRDWLFHTR